MAKPMNKKKLVSTDLFKDKAVPNFVRENNLFRNPVKYEKIFPSIGLPNFKDKVNIDKCLVDIKKEGSFVHNLLRYLADTALHAKEAALMSADRIQYLETSANREANRGKVKEFYNLIGLLTKVAMLVDPYSRGVLDKAIQSTEGKIALKLISDVSDASDKITFREGESLFKVFNKLREKSNNLGIAFSNVEQSDAFKIFCKENIPNKEFSIYFASDGEEGAWDILTMSMRGIKSCQRWDGDYPQCLIGSVLSKFVGIIYLTSGVQSDPAAGFNNLGSKMMRRSVVRYAVDADENKPCILIDKMYPDLDRDILNVFINAIKTKTSLPVYYSPELGNKLRHMYIPTEEIRKKISNREWSYQDSPLKSKDDFNVYILAHNKDEIEREVRGFKVNLALFLARKMDNIYSDSENAIPEIKKTINNIRLNTSFTPFCESIVDYIVKSFKPPVSKNFTDSKSYYRKYVMEFLLKRKSIMQTSNPNLTTLIQQFTSRTVDIPAFTDYITTLVIKFIKQEATRLIN